MKLGELLSELHRRLNSKYNWQVSRDEVRALLDEIARLKCADAPTELPAIELTAEDYAYAQAAEDQRKKWPTLKKESSVNAEAYSAWAHYHCRERQLAAVIEQRDHALHELEKQDDGMSLDSEKGGWIGVEHQARKTYKGRASYDFIETGFAVTIAGHKIAECEDSEIADWICKQWNLSPQGPNSANAETTVSSEAQSEHDYYNCGDEDCEACREFRRDGDG